MAEPKANRPSETAMLVGEIIADAQKLVRQELELAKVEIRQEWVNAKVAAVSIVTAAAFVFLAVLLFTFGLVFLLHDLTALPMSACFGIVILLTVLVGSGFYYLAVKKAKAVDVIPRQTVRSIKESVKWIRSRA